LPLRASTDATPSHPIVPASLSSAQRHQWLLRIEGDKPVNQKFKTYPIGHFHIDIIEVRTKEGKLYLFEAIDRTSKLAFEQLH